MAVVRKALHPLIREVVVYAGHSNHPPGPYSAHLAKRIQMFKDLNSYREERGRPAWSVRVLKGEELIDSLGDPKHTLLAVPAEPSSFLDRVFTEKELTSLRRKFFEMGGRGYFTCGSAYWVSRTRTFDDVVKESRMPLLNGVAKGPLCRFQQKPPSLRFVTDAVTLQSGKEKCSMYLSGGGSFELNDARARVLARYPHSELERMGMPQSEWAKNDIASLMTPVGKGAVALLMGHPYFGTQDICSALPGINFQRMRQALSPAPVRMRFMLDKILHPLEDASYDSTLRRHQSLHHLPRQPSRPA